MPSLILRGLERDRYAVVKAFAALPPEGFNFIVGQMLQIGLTAGGFQTDSREALQALSEKASAFFEAQKRDAP